MLSYVVSVAAIEKLSEFAVGVRVMFEPAVIVSVSVLLSAERLVDPTLTVLNAFWLTSAPEAIPSSFDLSVVLIRPAAVVDASALGIVTVCSAKAVR